MSDKTNEIKEGLKLIQDSLEAALTAANAIEMIGIAAFLKSQNDRAGIPLNHQISFYFYTMKMSAAVVAMSGALQTIKVIRSIFREPGDE